MEMLTVKYSMVLTCCREQDRYEEMQFFILNSQRGRKSTFSPVNSRHALRYPQRVLFGYSIFG